MSEQQDHEAGDLARIGTRSKAVRFRPRTS